MVTRNITQKITSTENISNYSNTFRKSEMDEYPANLPCVCRVDKGNSQTAMWQKAHVRMRLKALIQIANRSLIEPDSRKNCLFDMVVGVLNIRRTSTYNKGMINTFKLTAKRLIEKLPLMFEPVRNMVNCETCYRPEALLNYRRKYCVPNLGRITPEPEMRAIVQAAVIPDPVLPGPPSPVAGPSGRGQTVRTNIRKALRIYRGLTTGRGRQQARGGSPLRKTAVRITSSTSSSSSSSSGSSVSSIASKRGTPSPASIASKHGTPSPASINRSPCHGFQTPVRPRTQSPRRSPPLVPCERTPRRPRRCGQSTPRRQPPRSSGNRGRPAAQGYGWMQSALRRQVRPGHMSQDIRRRTATLLAKLERATRKAALRGAGRKSPDIGLLQEVNTLLQEITAANPLTPVRRPVGRPRKR